MAHGTNTPPAAPTPPHADHSLPVTLRKTRARACYPSQARRVPLAVCARCRIVPEPPPPPATGAPRSPHVSAALHASAFRRTHPLPAITCALKLILYSESCEG
ncbi:hypothetical protein GGX14DRAFT_564266 [Mycena pura]|uniref:Uncharacterized protein n=1 Tax=Mycena pura TaxID=153505 RepID=A0AAD6VGN0_9AGAR|nr:hypothetical protein GGX14DRAFT_564266 [Mycena pura]